MAIVQVTTFVCEKCGAHETEVETMILYEKVQVKRKGWEEANGDLLCPHCDTE